MVNRMGQLELENIFKRYGNKEAMSKADILEFYTSCLRSLNRSLIRLVQAGKVERFKPLNSTKYFYKYIIVPKKEDSNGRN